MNRVCFYNPEEKIWSGLTSPPLYSIDANLGEQILMRMIQTPANVYQVSDDTGIELTNSEVYQRSIKIANFLTNLGLKQNDVLGLLGMNSENVSSLMFGCFTLGIAIHPLNVVMNSQDIKDRWSITKPKAVFCDEIFVPMIQKVHDEMDISFEIFTLTGKVNGYTSIDEILSDNFDVETFVFPILPNIATTNALILCSSGTTDSPKDVCKSHRQVLATFCPYNKVNIHSQEVAFNSVSPFWVSNPLFAVCSALYGYKMIITSKVVTPDLWMDIIERHKISIILTVPIFTFAWLQSQKLRKLETIRVFILTGACFSEDLVKNIKPYIPKGKIYCGYGCTESDTITCLRETKGNSSGFPVKNIKIKIVDEAGNNLGPNQVGEICFKTLVPFAGYFGDPEGTKNALDSSGFFKSGDLGYFDDEGYIYVVERVKNLIKTMESRVTPIEIEREINKIEGVIRSCVIGIADKKTFSDIVYAFVIKAKTNIELTEQYIMKNVNERVENIKKITGGVIFTDSFPMTPTGKLMNRELKKIASRVHEEKAANLTWKNINNVC